MSTRTPGTGSPTRSAIGILLTGPTMREYWIVDRTTRDLCPPGTPILTFGGLER